VRKVARHAPRVGDVVQREVADGRVLLEQEGEGLADAAGGAEDGDLGLFFVLWFRGF